MEAEICTKSVGKLEAAALVEEVMLEDNDFYIVADILEEVVRKDHDK